MTVTAADFDQALDEIFSRSEELGLVAIEVQSGNLHRAVGEYPGQDHRMPMCCDAMYRKMKASDSVICKPDSSKGASLVMRYEIPR